MLLCAVVTFYRSGAFATANHKGSEVIAETRTRGCAARPKTRSCRVSEAPLGPRTRPPRPRTTAGEGSPADGRKKEPLEERRILAYGQNSNSSIRLF